MIEDLSCMLGRSEFINSTQNPEQGTLGMFITSVAT